MKRPFILIFILLPFFCFSQNDKPGQLRNFVKRQYKIQYPTNWTLDTSKTLGADFFIFSSLENDKDKFRENINLLVQDLGVQNIDLVKYAQLSERQIKELATEGKIYESKKIMKPGKTEYHKMIYGMMQGVFKLKIEQYYFIKNHKAFILTFTAEFDKFDTFLSAGEQILNSFVLTK